MGKFLWAFVALFLLTGCHDYRYDDCAKKNPKTVDYLACVKKFQDQDDDDTAAMVAVQTSLSAATMVATMN